MTRFIFTVAVLFLIFHLARRLMAQPPPPTPDTPPRSKPPLRGAPRSVVCGECGTQFEPSSDGWICPTCGK